MKRWTKWAVGAGVAGSVYVLLDALILEKYFFDIKEFDIGEKNSNEKIKLLLLSDLHFKQKLGPFYKRLVRKIKDINPDIILITGDLIDQTGVPAPARKFFQLLPHHIPKAAILGNHDHKSEVSLQTLKDIYQKHNGDLLINESKAYAINGHTLMVTGVDDFIEGSAHFEDAVKNVGKEAHHILLVHSPMQQEVIQRKIKNLNANRGEDRQLHIQYIFAGHNHGGQVQLLGWTPVLPEKSGNYISGWYNTEAPYLYLSKGFGTTAVPVRFGARSEVTVFNYYV